MNSLVALPILAATPTVAPAMPCHPSDDRLVAAAEGAFASESAIDQLYRDHVDGDGEVDERADCQALFAVQDQHIETLISVPATSTAGLRAKASVARAHFMIGRLKHQQLAVSLADDLVGEARSTMYGDRSHPDAELLSLAAKYVTTEAEHLRLYELYVELEDAFLNEGMPEALRVRPADAEFGIHAFFGRLGEDHNYFNIDVLRWPKWPHPDSKVEIERGRIVAERLVEPSPEARARADEIIAANDQWQKTKKKKKPRHLVAIGRKRAQLVKLMNELDELITKMPATTMEGMVAKAKCAKVYDEDCIPDCDDPLSMFGASIVRDLLARGGAAPAPVDQEA